MSTASALVVLAAAALGTYLARSSLILALSHRSLPVSIERSLQFVGPAVLAALSINLAVGVEGVGSVAIAEFAALVVAAAIAVWRRDLVLTLFAGMATLWIVSALG